MPYIRQAPLQSTFCDEDFIIAPNDNLKTSLKVKDEDVIVAADSSDQQECFTARKIIEEVIDISSESLGLCTVSENQLLALFRRSLSEMFAINGEGSTEYNFMIRQAPIAMIEGTETYQTPSDYKSKISLYASKDKKKVQMLFRDRVSWADQSGVNVWTIEAGNILIKLPDSHKRNDCGCCEKCEACTNLKSYIMTLEYYSYPPRITSLDQPLCWLKNNNDIWNYLVEAMMEQLYLSQSRQYSSPTKVFYRNQLLKWDQDLNPVDEKVKTNRQSVTISKY